MLLPGAGNGCGVGDLHKHNARKNKQQQPTAHNDVITISAGTTATTTNCNERNVSALGVVARNINVAGKEDGSRGTSSTPAGRLTRRRTVGPVAVAEAYVAVAYAPCRSTPDSVVVSTVLGTQVAPQHNFHAEQHTSPNKSIGLKRTVVTTVVAGALA